MPIGLEAGATHITQAHKVILSVAVLTCLKFQSRLVFMNTMLRPFGSRLICVSNLRQRLSVKAASIEYGSRDRTPSSILFFVCYASCSAAAIASNA